VAPVFKKQRAILRIAIKNLEMQKYSRYATTALGASPTGTGSAAVFNAWRRYVAVIMGRYSDNLWLSSPF
jgi:hypothetical protein